MFRVALTNFYLIIMSLPFFLPSASSSCPLRSALEVWWLRPWFDIRHWASVNVFASVRHIYCTWSLNDSPPLTNSPGTPQHDPVKRFYQLRFLAGMLVHRALVCGVWSDFPVSLWIDPSSHTSLHHLQIRLFAFPPHQPCTNLVFSYTCLSRSEKYGLLLLIRTASKPKVLKSYVLTDLSTWPDVGRRYSWNESPQVNRKSSGHSLRFRKLEGNTGDLTDRLS